MKPTGYQSGLNYGYGYGLDAVQPTPEQIAQVQQDLPPIVNPEQSAIVKQAREYTSFCGDQSIHRLAEIAILSSSVVLPTLLGFVAGIPFGKKGKFALYGLGLGAIRGAYYAYSVRKAIKERCG